MSDLYFPVMQGCDFRIGRFISIPDIEAQLAPNNYTYVHSLTYSWDNYTNTGFQGTLAVTKNWILQLGLTVGSDTMPWNAGARIPNYYVLPERIHFIPVRRCSRIPGQYRRSRWAFAGPATMAGTT